MAKKRNTPIKIVLPMDEVQDMYENQLMTLQNIGKHFKCHQTTVKKRMIAHGIRIRTHSENQKIAMNKPGVKENVSKASKASAEQRKETNRKRFGADTPMGNPEIQKRMKENRSDDHYERRQKKIEATNLERHGVKNVSHLQETKDKIRQKRWLDKTDEELKEIMRKTNESNLKKYGTIYPTQNKDIAKKMSVIRLGFSDEKKLDIQEKCKISNLKKYGVENPAMNPDIAKSIGRSHVKNYVKNTLPNQLKELNLEVVLPHGETLESHWKTSFHEYKFKCTKCGLIFSHIWNYIIRDGYRCTTCYPRAQPAINPKAEEEIYRFLIDDCEFKEDDVIRQERNKIKPYQLDFYIPSMEIAIEHNGLYWHSDAHRSNDYHNMKYNLCKDQGIRLIQIFEDEWSNIPDLKLKLMNEVMGIKLINIFEDVEYEFIEIDSDDKDIIIIGFVYDNDIYGYLCFQKKDNDFLIIDYDCKGIDFVFENILIYFKDNYDYNSINIYNDLLWEEGELLTNLGFKYINFINPGEFYVRGNKRFLEEDCVKGTEYNKVYDAGFELYRLK